MISRSPSGTKWAPDLNASQIISLSDTNDNKQISLDKPIMYGLFGYEYDQDYDGNEKISFLVDGNLTDYMVNELGSSPGLFEIDLNLDTNRFLGFKLQCDR